GCGGRHDRRGQRDGGEGRVGAAGGAGGVAGHHAGGGRRPRRQAGGRLRYRLHVRAAAGGRLGSPRARRRRGPLLGAHPRRLLGGGDARRDRRRRARDRGDGDAGQRRRRQGGGAERQVLAGGLPRPVGGDDAVVVERVRQEAGQRLADGRERDAAAGGRRGG